MKKIYILLAILIASNSFGQNYDSKKLTEVAKIWGECYLFHPNIVRSDKKINWENKLVDFLPKTKYVNSTEEFIEIINSDLLSHLNDPLTCVQNKTSIDLTSVNKTLFKQNTNHDYFLATKDFLESSNGWVKFDSLISDKTSEKPLILDLRISSNLDLDPHQISTFEYISSMLINKEISLGSKVSREHFGWDERNDWWYYEQRWKVSSNGNLSPIKDLVETIQYQYPNTNLSSIEHIKRPIYFMVNKSILTYFVDILKALQTYRPNTFIILDETGKVYTPWYSTLKTIPFSKYEFTLNTNFLLTDLTPDLVFDYRSKNIDPYFIDQISLKKEASSNKFNLDIIPKPYISQSENLTLEEKILGIIKTWTVVKYFYVHHNLASKDWNELLEPYLIKCQKCETDQAYFMLIKEMMASLNDSHVSTFHPSILDFSKIFVAPLEFAWIENKVIITAITPELEKEYDINIGDEILNIDDKSILEITNEHKKMVSASNSQAFYSTVFCSGNFVNSPSIDMNIKIASGKKTKSIKLPRTVPIFEFMNYGDHRPSSKILKNNIGYLNLSKLTDPITLETELKKMKDTEALIIDLRNGYPTYDFQHFIELIIDKAIDTRIDETPIVCSNKLSTSQYAHFQSKIYPDKSFSYTNRIAVLIDKSMISRPEDIAIQLKEIENVIFIGEQTQGTDGEMTKIHLPGGGETSFTGQIIKYANGQDFQGIGIIPDIKVERTVKGIKKGKDEILEKAIESISSK